MILRKKTMKSHNVLYKDNWNNGKTAEEYMNLATDRKPKYCQSTTAAYVSKDV